jgi:hypothetical protein
VAKIDVKDLSSIDLTSLIDEIRSQAGRRASELFGDSSKQASKGLRSARRALADPADGDMFGAFALGILVGAVIGAAFALLMAPFSGAEARRKLGQKVEEIRPEAERLGVPLGGKPGNGESVYQPRPESAYPGGSRP